MADELLEVAEGLWLWRTEHPDWRPDAGWDRLVASTFVRSRGHTAVLDPIAPPKSAADVWARLDDDPPALAVVLKPDHVRDVDLFVRRYGARGFGPSLFWPHDVPESELEPIDYERALELPPWDA